MTVDHLIFTMAKAIATVEGFYRGGDQVSRKLNNPGCLLHWKDTRGRPYPETNGFVEFPNVKIGWRALRAQVSINVRKRRCSLFEFFCGKPRYRGFCKQGDNAERYALDVANVLNIDTHNLPMVELCER